MPARRVMRGQQKASQWLPSAHIPSIHGITNEKDLARLARVIKDDVTSVAAIDLAPELHDGVLDWLLQLRKFIFRAPLPDQDRFELLARRLRRAKQRDQF